MLLTKDKRQSRRFRKRLLVRIGSETFSCGGIMSDVSKNGMFIRSGLLPNDTVLTIALYLPGNRMCSLKGIAKRNVKIADTNWLFGTGIELTEKDALFNTFLKTLTHIVTGKAVSI
jgi:hypothetical protein